MFLGNMPSQSKSESVTGRLTAMDFAGALSRTISATIASWHNMLFLLQVITASRWVRFTQPNLILIKKRAIKIHIPRISIVFPANTLNGIRTCSQFPSPQSDGMCGLTSLESISINFFFPLRSQR